MSDTARHLTGIEAPEAFRVRIDQSRIEAILGRVAARVPFAPPSDEGDDWNYGVNSAWLADFCDYWTKGYSWDDAEARLNRFPQYTTTIDGVRLHYVAIRGEGPRRPLLMLHGWPGSHAEFRRVAEPLAFPSRHGGSAADAFDLVIPSLPGYGFSGPSARPMGMRTAASLLNRLMTDVLGHTRYMVQGGDWGAVVATWLGVDHAASVSAVHVNLVGFRPSLGDTGAGSAEEEAQIDAIMTRERPSLAYAMQQATRPQTLAIALMDSPVGTAAWILDKFWHWSDLRGHALDEVFSRDELLDNIMIYLVNGTMASSLWSYRGMAEERVALAEHPYCGVPTAIAKFPFERVGATPPRPWVERFYNVARWREFDAGGHFAALEAAGSFVTDVRDFGREYFAAANA